MTQSNKQSIHTLLVELLVFFLFLCGRSVQATTYFVAIDGSDQNPGTTLEAPFRNLQRAATNMVAGDACLIRAGVYRETLRPARSGSPGSPITFTAFSNEVVTISGAELVTGWRRGPNGIYSASVNWELGAGYNQVFVDGEMAQQARYPGFGSGDLLHPETVAVSIDPPEPSVVISDAWNGRADNFWAGAWFCGAVGEQWSWQCARVLSSSGNRLVLDPATQSRPWFTGAGNGFVWGLLDLLSDNQWHLQTSSGGPVLFLKLARGINPEVSTIEMKRRKWCVDVNGRSHIIIRGLHFRAGAVRLNGEGNVLEDCQARFLSHFLRYQVGYTYNGGIPQGGGVVLEGTHNTVRNCEIFDTAGSGIVSGGSSNFITRNLIYHTDYSGTYGSAVRLRGTGDRVTFNTAYSSGRDILQPYGAGQVICYNDFFGPGQLCRDLGVVYVWGVDAQAAGGERTRIAFNWLHDNIGPGPRPLVYLDNWCRNFVVDHNVCWNSSGDAGIRINGPASGHQLFNNTLFNCGDLGTHTYDMWPDNNPNPSVWTSDRYDYSALNNLFLGNWPQVQLRAWSRADFRLRPGAAAMGSGVPIAGYTHGYPKATDQGAYESGSFVWKAGRNAWSEPKLKITRSATGTLTLTAPATGGSFELFETTNLAPPVLWTPVTNLTCASASEWTLTLPASTVIQQRFFKLEPK